MTLKQCIAAIVCRVMSRVGIVKIQLPSSAFLDCAERHGDHTLFKDVDSRNVKMKEIQEYLNLIVGLYELSPEGHVVMVLVYSIHTHIMILVMRALW